MAARFSASLRDLACRSAAAASLVPALMATTSGTDDNSAGVFTKHSTCCEERIKPATATSSSQQIYSVQNVGLGDKIGHAFHRKESSPKKNGAKQAKSQEDEQLPPAESRTVKTFERVAPSVAYIQTTAIVEQYGSPSRRLRPFSLQEMEIAAGTGSGFVYDSNGHIITNYHVIASSGSGSKVKVKCRNMAEACDATIVGFDAERDIAVLKISGEKGAALPPPIEMGDSSNLKVGQTVLAVGNPFGLDTTLTTGVVSAIGRDVMGAGGRPIRGCIQTDAAINPGSSGGPLVDSSGRLVGVNMAILSPMGVGGGNIGIGFAIPSSTVKRIVDQIIKHGRVYRPSLGINVADDRIVQSIGVQLGMKMKGVLVAEVLPEGPADVAGITSTKYYYDGTVDLGDLIVEVDGRPIGVVEDLLEVLEEHRNGDEVEIKVLQGCDPKHPKVFKAKLSSDEPSKASMDVYRKGRYRRDRSSMMSGTRGGFH